MLFDKLTTSQKESGEITSQRSMLFGVDVGTTAVKCAVVSASSADHELLAASYVALDEVSLSSAAAAQMSVVPGEQNVEQLLHAVHKAIIALPLELREQVTSIGICGQVRNLCTRAADVDGKL